MPNATTVPATRRAGKNPTSRVIANLPRGRVEIRVEVQEGHPRGARVVISALFRGGATGPRIWIPAGFARWLAHEILRELPRAAKPDVEVLP